MEVIDICSFNNELEILDLRVKILENIVDKFYVIESTKTHSGLPKDCVGRLYEHPKVQIITIDFPDGLDTWQREHYQRAYAVDLDSFSKDSLVITSDLDEIADPNAIAWLKENFDSTLIYTLGQKMYQYYLNVFSEEKWASIRVCSIENYNKYNADILRHGGLPTMTLDDAGWHWSFLGGEEAIEHKIKSYAHQEFNSEETITSIKERLLNNEDVFDRGFALTTVPIDETFPEYIRNNQDKLKHLIKGI